MNLSTKPLVAALVGLALTPMIPASANQEHHQPDAATTAAPAAVPTEPPANMPATQMMMPMMNMMGQQPAGMPMMDMMGQDAMPMMDMGDHLEGRIAFLRAELGITAAQAAKWDVFAQALRDGAVKMNQARTSAHQPANGSTDVLQRMEQEEQRLAARLESIKAIRTTFAELQAVLSNDQRKTAEALLTRPVCLGSMGVL